MNHNENSEKMNQITMLGTGNATVSQIYNTCFLLQTSSTLMLVDAGGGNGILAQLKKVNVQISDIHHLFVTHAHTDHVLGVIWVIRMVAQCKGYEGLLPRSNWLRWLKGWCSISWKMVIVSKWGI